MPDWYIEAYIFSEFNSKPSPGIAITCAYYIEQTLYLVM